jgi:hypothetical protein
MLRRSDAMPGNCGQQPLFLAQPVKKSAEIMNQELLRTHNLRVTQPAMTTDDQPIIIPPQW